MIRKTIIHDNETTLEQWTQMANEFGFKVEFDVSLNTWFADSDEIMGTFCLDEDCTTRAWMDTIVEEVA
jgi:hypothetical protein